MSNTPARFNKGRVYTVKFDGSWLNGMIGSSLKLRNGDELMLSYLREVEPGTFEFIFSRVPHVNMIPDGDYIH